MRRSRAAGFALVLASLVLAGWRGAEARADVLRWEAAARVAEARTDRIRLALAGVEPSDAPVLALDLPRTRDGAYALHYGVADRFRAPLPAAPRPVWPYRPLFPGPEAERPALVVDPRDDLLFLFGGRARRVAGVPIAVDGLLVPATGAEGPALAADERLFLQPGLEDTSPELEIFGAHAGERFELVLYTELGYAAAAWNAPEPRAPSSERADLGPRRALRLRAALNEHAPLALALVQAADFGATRALLEVRVLDAAGRLVAASTPVRIEWAPALRELLVPR
jgi:hypothetical protein